MVRYIIRKVVAMIPKMLIISLIIFFGLQLLPGDPITRTFSPEQLSRLTEAQIDVLREAAGLNDPLMVQYFSWLGRMLGIGAQFAKFALHGGDAVGFLETQAACMAEMGFAPAEEGQHRQKGTNPAE